VAGRDQSVGGASLREGLEETLTVHRLGLPEPLRKSLQSTNLTESAIHHASADESGETLEGQGHAFTLVGLAAAGSGETLPARTRLQADDLLD